MVVSVNRRYFSIGSVAFLLSQCSRPKKRKDIRHLISVKDYGAAGDGVTDDTNAFVAAMAVCASLKQSLSVPAGTYAVSALNYPETGYVRQFCIYGDGYNQTIIRKIASSSLPLFTVGQAAATHFTGNISISGLTFDGLDGNTPAAFQAYDLVWSDLSNCAFKNAGVGLQLYGGIDIAVNNCVIAGNSTATNIAPFASQAGGGAPNNVRFTKCVISAPLWAIWADGGTMLQVTGCDVENSGTAGITSGGIYVGPKMGGVGAVVESCWLEANKGTADIYLNGGRNVVRSCFFLSPSATNDVRIDGGSYALDACHAQTAKAANLLEGANVGSPNVIFFCDFPSRIIDGNKTKVLP